MKISLVIPGPPVGKGRPRFTRQGHAFTPKKTRTHEAFIKALFVQKYGTDFAPLEGPLEMDVLVFFPIPASASKKRRHDMTWGVECPTKRPDLSNAIKAAEDALNGLAYRDDAQIVSFAAVKKYSNNAHTEIKVRPVGEEP